MKYPKGRELLEAVKALLRGPYTAKFPKVAHQPFPRFRGRPVPNNDECIGCGACAQVCPPGAIEVIDEKNPDAPLRRLIWHYDECIFCGQCEKNCSTRKGVQLSNEYDLATPDRKTLSCELKKELLLCSGCGEIIGPKAQVLWLARKLGPKAYGNTLLLNALQNELRPQEEADRNKLPSMKRTLMFELLCSKCRHKILVFDEYGN